MSHKLTHYAYPILWMTALVILAHLLGNILVPLLFSFFLAYLCYPIVKKLQKWGLNHTFSVWITFLCTFLLLSAMGFLLVPVLIHKAILFIRDIPDTAIGFIYSIEKLAESFDIYFHIEPKQLTHLIKTHLTTLSGSSIATLTSLLKSMFSNVLDTFIWFLSFLLFPVLFYHALARYEKIKKEFQEFIPERHHAFLASFSQVFDTILSNYIRGQFIVCTTLALMFSTGLWLVGLKYGIMIGLMTGYLMVIPYVGFFIGLSVSLMIGFSNGYPLEHMAGILGVFLFVQGSESFVITPKIMGRKVGLDPFVTLLAIIVGGHLLGIAGIVLAVPTSAILKHFYGSLKENYKHSDFFLKKN